MSYRPRKAWRHIVVDRLRTAMTSSHSVHVVVIKGPQYAVSIYTASVVALPAQVVIQHLDHIYNVSVLVMSWACQVRRAVAMHACRDEDLLICRSADHLNVGNAGPYDINELFKSRLQVSATHRG